MAASEAREIKKPEPIHKPRRSITHREIPSAYCELEPPAELILSIDLDIKRVLGKHYTLGDLDLKQLRQALTAGLELIEQYEKSKESR